MSLEEKRRLLIEKHRLEPLSGSAVSGPHLLQRQMQVTPQMLYQPTTTRKIGQMSSRSIQSIDNGCGSIVRPTRSNRGVYNYKTVQCTHILAHHRTCRLIKLSSPSRQSMNKSGVQANIGVLKRGKTNNVPLSTHTVKERQINAAKASVAYHWAT